MFLVLGAVGVPSPVLSTTPLLLLAAACCLRGSPWMHDWLMSNEISGRYLASYRAGRGVPARVKVAAIAVLWLSIGVSAGFFLPGVVDRAVLATIVSVVTVRIATIRTGRCDSELNTVEAA